jgi:hypothetical protein
MSYLALAQAALLRGNERSEEREKSEENHVQREDCPASATEAWNSSRISLSSHSHVPAAGGTPANGDGDALEPVGVILDEADDPALPCGTCGAGIFHQPPGDRWRCSGCEPPTLPGDAAALAGWAFCSLPPEDPAQDALPGARGNAQNADSESGQAEPQRAEALPGAPCPPWDDDREWIRLWRTAGPALTDRRPVVEAWIAVAPEQPLPRTLAAVELKRIAAQHAVEIEVALQNTPPRHHGDAPERDSTPTRPR